MKDKAISLNSEENLRDKMLSTYCEISFAFTVLEKHRSLKNIGKK